MLVEYMTAASQNDTIIQDKKTRSQSAQSTQKNTSKATLIQRLWNAAEAQICDIEQRLIMLDSSTAQFEKDARSLALLAKFLKELMSIECLMSNKKASTKTSKLKIEDKNAPPRNLEHFREELEKRLTAMRQGGDTKAVYE
jgi:hypothetical protein